LPIRTWTKPTSVAVAMANPAAFSAELPARHPDG
jgi:hypothetical protein